MNQQISVIGLGFVGLTTALGFAEKGHHVIGFDAAPSRLGEIARQRVPFHEPGLDQALSAHLGNHFLIADSLADAVRQSEIVFVCVGTPSSDNGAADLSILLDAIRQIVVAADDTHYRLLVVKSTVPPGTVEGVVSDFLGTLGHTPGEYFGLASNPEFLREGYAWDDFIHPDRIVVGVADDRGWVLMESAYARFDAPVHRVTPTEAEFIKYLSNTLLATLISFSNEMSLIAQRVGNIDIARTFRILHGDKRWFGNPAAMASYVYPGCGYGGYCLPKDTQAMAHLAREKGLEPGLLEQVIATNRKIKTAAVDRITAIANPASSIGILGLSFKPESDDVRDSPARDIIQGLLERGFKRVIAHDPLAAGNFAAAFELPIQYAETLDNLVEQSDVLVVVTAWPTYRKLLSLAGGKPVVDLRYCLSADHNLIQENVE